MTHDEPMPDIRADRDLEPSPEQPTFASRHVEPLPRVNPWAITAIVLALIPIWGVGSVLAIAASIKARKQISTLGERGEGLANAALWIGIGTLALLGLIIYWLIDYGRSV